jgi:hypothetical protein
MKRLHTEVFHRKKPHSLKLLEPHPLKAEGKLRE